MLKYTFNPQKQRVTENYSIVTVTLIFCMLTYIYSMELFKVNKYIVPKKEQPYLAAIFFFI